MMDTYDYWKSLGYELVTTDDGSPSLKPLDGFELMHHKGGAWSETQLIYGEVLRDGFSQGLDHVMAVGLGAGYNELVFADSVIGAGRQSSARLISFESSETLKIEFLAFLQDPKPDCIYGNILSRCQNQNLIPGFLLELKNQKRWRLQGVLNRETLATVQWPINIFLYDAFSSRTTPELWSETFLETLMNIADPKCLFTTYACTGALKRVLKTHGFDVQLREGFKGKRNSTLAARGITPRCRLSTAPLSST